MSVTNIFQGKFPVVNIHGYVKKIARSAHVLLSCNGVLMSKVQEPITMLRLTSTGNCKAKLGFLRRFHSRCCRDIFFYLGKSQNRIINYSRSQLSVTDFPFKLENLDRRQNSWASDDDRKMNDSSSIGVS